MSYLGKYLSTWGHVQDRNKLIEVMKKCIEAMKEHGDAARASAWEAKIDRLPKNMTKQSIDGVLQMASLEAGLTRYA